MKLNVYLKFAAIYIYSSGISQISSNPSAYNEGGYSSRPFNTYYNQSSGITLINRSKSRSDSINPTNNINTPKSLKNGYWIDYYPNGVKKEEGHVSNSLKEGYWKAYHNNGVIKEQGEYFKNKKTGYWYFYTPNAETIKEGHFMNNTPKMWWKFYNEQYLEKCIYQRDGKTRFCLIYKANKLIKGKKYINDTFAKEWNSLKSFRKDNPNFSF